MSKPSNPLGAETLRQIILKIMLPDLYKVAFFSAFINLLILSPSWYMLEVYDRVVNSQNIYTLWMLTALILFLYAILELLEWVRMSIFQGVGRRIDKGLRERIFSNMFKAKLMQIPGASSQPLVDLKTIQNAITSPVLTALIDVPFAIFALIYLFIIHSYLGWFAIVGALILFFIGWVNERFIHPPLTAASRDAMHAQNYFNSSIRNVEVIKSMGMLDRIHKTWAKKHHQFLKQQSIASARAGANGAISKLTQTIQSSFILGFACWLIIRGDMSGQGADMIVASILGGRMLAPLVQLIAHWRVVVNVRESYTRLNQFLKLFPKPQDKMELPAPKGFFTVEGLIACPPHSTTPILRGINFQLAAGRSLAIIGPSASGKTTLARLLLGIWPATHGKVRLDGVDVHAWDKNELGPYMGYLPQYIELFDGTLAENIARFGAIDKVKIKEAVKVAGLEDFIATLPDGYQTEIGEEGAFISGGQRQRIGLARAIYGSPQVVVLDEPNASLDEAGDAALHQAIMHLKTQGTNVIVITHRESLLNLMDDVMVLLGGEMKLFGPRDEVMASLKKGAQIPKAATSHLEGNQ